MARDAIERFQDHYRTIETETDLLCEERRVHKGTQARHSKWYNEELDKLTRMKNKARELYEKAAVGGPGVASKVATMAAVKATRDGAGELNA